MTTLASYIVDTKAFAGTAQRREEVLLPLAKACIQEGSGVELAQLALYQAASVAALKGRADKGLLDLAYTCARIDMTILKEMTLKIIKDNTGISDKEVIVKIAAKISSTSRHLIAVESAGFKIEELKPISEIEANLAAALKESE